MLSQVWQYKYEIDYDLVWSFNTFVVLRAFMAGAASQAGDADSSRAPGITSGLQGFVSVQRGAILLVTHWQCISSFAFYIQSPVNIEIDNIFIGKEMQIMSDSKFKNASNQNHFQNNYDGRKTLSVDIK